jgi:hypothetical protein
MEKTDSNQDLKGPADAAALLDQLTETLLSKTRKALKFGGCETRKQVVRTTLQMDRLLGEGL